MVLLFYIEKKMEIAKKLRNGVPEMQVINRIARMHGGLCAVQLYQLKEQSRRIRTKHGIVSPVWAGWTWHAGGQRWPAGGQSIQLWLQAGSCSVAATAELRPRVPSFFLFFPPSPVILFSSSSHSAAPPVAESTQLPYSVQPLHTPLYLVLTHK